MKENKDKAWKQKPQDKKK